MKKLLLLLCITFLYCQISKDAFWKCMERPFRCAIDIIDPEDKPKTNTQQKDGKRTLAAVAAPNVVKTGFAQKLERRNHWHGGKFAIKGLETGVLGMSMGDASVIAKHLRRTHRFTVHVTVKKNAHVGSIFSINKVNPSTKAVDTKSPLINIFYPDTYIIPDTKKSLCFSVLTTFGTKQVCTDDKFPVRPESNILENIWVSYTESGICLRVDAAGTPNSGKEKCVKYPQDMDLSNWDSAEMQIGSDKNPWSGEILDIEFGDTGSFGTNEEAKIIPMFNCIQIVGNGWCRGGWGFNATQDMDIAHSNENTYADKLSAFVAGTSDTVLNTASVGKLITLVSSCRKEGNTITWWIVNANKYFVTVTLKTELTPNVVVKSIKAGERAMVTFYGEQSQIYETPIRLFVGGNQIKEFKFNPTNCLVNPGEERVNMLSPLSNADNINKLPTSFMSGYYERVFYTEFPCNKKQVWTVGSGNYIHTAVSSLKAPSCDTKKQKRGAVLSKKNVKAVKTFALSANKALPLATDDLKLNNEPCCDPAPDKCGPHQRKMVRISASDGKPSHYFTGLFEPHHSKITLNQLYRYDTVHPHSIGWNIPYYPSLVDSLWVVPIEIGNDIFMMVVADSPASHQSCPMSKLKYDFFVHDNTKFATNRLIDDPEDVCTYNQTTKRGKCDFKWLPKHTDGQIFGPIDGCFNISVDSVDGLDGKVKILHNGFTNAPGNVHGVQFQSTKVYVNDKTEIRMCVECGGCIRDHCGVCNGNGTSCPHMHNGTACKTERDGHIIHKGECPAITFQNTTHATMELKMTGIPSQVIPKVFAKCPSGIVELPKTLISMVPVPGGGLWKMYTYSITLPWSFIDSCFGLGSGYIILAGYEGTKEVYNIPCNVISKKTGHAHVTLFYTIKHVGFDVSFEAFCKNDTEALIVVKTSIDKHAFPTSDKLVFSSLHKMFGHNLAYEAATECEMSGSVCSQTFLFTTVGTPYHGIKSGNYKIGFNLVTSSGAVVLSNIFVYLKFEKMCNGYTEIGDVQITTERYDDWNLTIPSTGFYDCKRVWLVIRPVVPHCNLYRIDEPYYRICWAPNGVPLPNCASANPENIEVIIDLRDPENPIYSSTLGAVYYLSNRTGDENCTDTIVISFITRIGTSYMLEGNTIIEGSVHVVPKDSPLLLTQSFVKESKPQLHLNTHTPPPPPSEHHHDHKHHHDHHHHYNPGIHFPKHAVVVSVIKFHPMCPYGHTFDHDHQHSCQPSALFKIWHWMQTDMFVLVVIGFVICVVTFFFVMACFCDAHHLGRRRKPLTTFYVKQK